MICWDPRLTRNPYAYLQMRSMIRNHTLFVEKVTKVRLSEQSRSRDQSPREGSIGLDRWSLLDLDIYSFV